MKKRTSPARPRRSREFKGVVKKITGKLTNHPELEQEGRAEMLGRKRGGASKRRRVKINPDAYRRG